MLAVLIILVIVCRLTKIRGPCHKLNPNPPVRGLIPHHGEDGFEPLSITPCLSISASMSKRPKWILDAVQLSFTLLLCFIVANFP